jgi:type I restriction enzyme S subunit
MSIELLLKEFHRIGEAPDAIPRLRQFILDLAIRGKLTSQESSYGSATDVLRRAKEHKLLFGENGKVRADSVDSDAPEPLFHIPSTWVWATLGAVTLCRDGERVPVSKEERSTRKKIYDYYGASGVIDKIDSYLFDKPLLLVGEDGANLINRSTPIAFIARGKYWVNNHAHTLDGFSEQLLQYLEIFLNATDLKPYVTGTAQPKMNQSRLNGIAVPLPPLREQMRIVAKVQHLFALCADLEASQTTSEAHRDKLVTSSLARLTAAPDESSFKESARFYFNHLPRLTARSGHVQQLRQTILALAVQGKLVPQNPTAEPTSEFIERTFKKRATYSLGNRESVPSTEEAIPSTWAWVKLSEITDVGTGSTPSRAEGSFWNNGSIPWVTSGLTSQDLITQAQEFVTDAAVKAHRLRLYPRGSLVVALYGQGKTRGQVATLGIPATINQACAAICVPNGVPSMQQYIKLLLKKQYDEMRLLSAGGAQPNLNVQKIKDLHVPLPPLEEQRRISSKVEELMAFCDQLESSMRLGVQALYELLKAALHHATQLEEITEIAAGA